MGMLLRRHRKKKQPEVKIEQPKKKQPKKPVRRKRPQKKSGE